MIWLLGFVAKLTLWLALGLAVRRLLPGSGMRHLALLLTLLMAPLFAVPNSAEHHWLTLPAPQFNLKESLSGAATQTPATKDANRSADAPVAWVPALGVGYILIAVGLALAAWLRHRRYVRRVFRQATPLAHPSDSPGSHTPLWISPACRAPFTHGTRPGVVVVPKAWHGWDEAKCRAVLLHEFAHIERRDALSARVASLICCALWLHPLAWLCLKHLRADAELACDDAVVLAGVDPLTYAERLVEIARGSRAQPAWSPAMAAPRSLETRIHALLDPDRRRLPMTRTHTLFTALLCLLLAAPVATTGAEPAVAPLSDHLHADLQQVQALIDQQDYEGALAAAEPLVYEAISPNEHAQVHNMIAYAYFKLEDYDNTIAHYEDVIGHAGRIPEGLLQTTLYSLAQLEFVQEDYPASLDYITRWLKHAKTPGPNPYIFMGQVYYQMKDYPNAVTQLEAGIERVATRSEVKENWWQLLAYLYDEQQDWPALERVLETLVEDYPSDVYRQRLEQLRAGELNG